MITFDPEKATEEDIVYLFFNSKGIMISEDFYEYVDIKKVRNAAIKDDYRYMMSNSKKMEIYAELAYKYSISIDQVRGILR
jgi:hypothetical protein